MFFFFNDTATTEIYTLSLHDALPIYQQLALQRFLVRAVCSPDGRKIAFSLKPDRKSTRLNSSHSQISYAVFCLKKKKKITSVDERAVTAISPYGDNSTRPTSGAVYPP